MSSGARFHSAYNPKREAERYIESLNIPPAMRFFILIECGLCYLIAPLKRKAPEARIVSLHFLDEYRNTCNENENNVPSWSPFLRESCEDFLEEHIGDTESRYIKIIEWKPAMEFDGRAYTSLLSKVVRFIKLSDANKHTKDFFRIRWQKNRVRNIKIFAKNTAQTYGLLAKNEQRDFIICAAGPGLEKLSDSIKKIQECGNTGIIAVSSAFTALYERQITPDVIVTSDGGMWAHHHLFALRRSGISKIIIAAELHSAIPSFCVNLPVILFGDGSDGEGELLKNAALPMLILPERGTVTATALEFALAYTTGKIYLVGADFSCEDIRSHARPYAFDVLLYERSTRISPVYHLNFIRTRNIKAGESHAIYSNWFRKQSSHYKGRVFNLGKDSSALNLPGIMPDALL